MRYRIEGGTIDIYVYLYAGIGMVYHGGLGAVTV
jgi:hypothetical protein